MKIPEIWEERAALAEPSDDPWNNDWCRFRVSYIDKNGVDRETEVTASGKLHAASQVCALGEVQKAEPI